MRRRGGVSGALLASLAMLLTPSCVHPHADPSQLALPPLRGGGRSLPPRKGVASGNLKKRATAGLSMTPAVGESQPTDTADKREGPAKSPDWGRARATGSSRRLSEVAMMIQDAVAEDPAAEDEVGLPYQQLTPLVSGHTDVKRARDAQSYCAEAARCLANFELEGAEACYQEALKLAPAKVRSNVCLRVHDTCTCTQKGVSRCNAAASAQIGTHDARWLSRPARITTMQEEGINSLRFQAWILDAYGSMLADQVLLLLWLCLARVCVSHACYFKRCCSQLACWLCKFDRVGAARPRCSGKCGSRERIVTWLTFVLARGVLRKRSICSRQV